MTTEKLCVFCEHFSWKKEYQWDTGSTMTGPMMTGGNAQCGKGHKLNGPRRPENEDDWRTTILTAQDCPDYSQVSK